MTLDKAYIRDGLRAGGLSPGDSLIMHCSLSSLGHVEGGADTLIDAVLEAVSPGGTVMMPALPDIYRPFDVRTSPSTAGLVSEVFWRRPDAFRSRHPSHSVAAIGPQARWLTEGHEHTDPTGIGSPYHKLYQQEGSWVLLIGVDHDRNTMLHLAEALVRVPYLRTSQLRVVNPDGSASHYRAREMAYGHREFIRIDWPLREANLQRQGIIGNAIVRLIRVRDLVDFAVRLLRSDPAALLCDKPRCIFCLWARAQIRSAQTGQPDETDWPDLTRRWGCGDPHCECCVV
ncbi:MAG: AAC(3) family N-acetyltransferase [Anaerolineae bacterium]|nr:AAC(3) family N-acetyltransferase [Anaerolineae bacterium]